MLLRKLESAKNSLQVQVSSGSVAAGGNTEKPASFVRSLWNMFMEDDQPSNQRDQESDIAKCIDMITKTQQHLRDFFQLTVCKTFSFKNIVICRFSIGSCCYQATTTPCWFQPLQSIHPIFYRIATSNHTHLYQTRLHKPQPVISTRENAGNFS